MRREYLKVNVKQRGIDDLTPEETAYLAAEMNMDTAGVKKMLEELHISVA